MRIPRLVPASILALALAVTASPASAAARLYIVQARTSAAARATVLGVHGTLERELPIIHAVAARLDSQQAARLRAIPAVHLFADRSARARATSGLLGGLTQTLSGTTNSLDQTLATNPLTSAVTGTAVPLVTSVTGNSLTSSVTSPLVSTLSAGTSTQDGKGVAALTLTYETNYRCWSAPIRCNRRGSRAGASRSRFSTRACGRTRCRTTARAFSPRWMSPTAARAR